MTCISLLSYQNNCFQQFVEKSDKAITSTVRTSSFIMNQGITDERRLGLVGEYIFNTIIWAGHLSQYHKRTEQSIGHFKLTAYTLTHTHTHAYTHSHTHTYTHSRIHTLTHTRTHTYTHSHIYTHTYTLTHTHTHTYTHSHTHTYTHSHIHTLTHTHTHAYTRVVQRNKNSMKTPTSSLKCTKFDWRTEWHKVYLGTVHFATRVNLIFVYHQAATV